jgi:outer membrane protein W
MKKSRMLPIIVAVALISVSSQVWAAETSEKPSNYVVMKAGIYSPSESFDLNNFNGGTTSKFDTKTGFAGEVAVGHYFTPNLAVELGAGYFQTKGSPAAQPGETMLRVVPLIATGKVFIPMGIFEPYGLGGIGAYVSDINVKGNSGNFSGSTEVTYGFHAGAGFNVNVTSNMFLGLEGKYLWAEPSFGGNNVKLDGFVTTANLGFRF